ncbi:hypothetical protein Drorol1_Dr00018252, partial [Drosera rotundifolia]
VFIPPSTSTTPPLTPLPSLSTSPPKPPSLRSHFNAPTLTASQTRPNPGKHGRTRGGTRTTASRDLCLSGGRWRSGWTLRYKVSVRVAEAARGVGERARVINQELEVSRRWREVEMNFKTNFPRVCV